MLSEAEVWRINILEGWVPDHDEDLVQMVASSQTLSRCVRSQAESLADVERIQDFLPTKGQGPETSAANLAYAEIRNIWGGKWLQPSLTDGHAWRTRP